MSINTLRINFDGMFEIFSRSLTLAHIRKKVCQVDTAAKMVVVNCQALFKAKDCLLDILLLLMADA